MISIKTLTIILIIILILLTITTFCVMLGNREAIRETFQSGVHNCYPYTSVLSASKSYKSLSKGRCTTGDAGESGLSEDDLGGVNESPVKCPDNYYRMSGSESLGHSSKAWCKRP